MSPFSQKEAHFSFSFLTFGYNRNMSEQKYPHLRRIASVLSKSPKKYISLESLSRMVGLYPDVLGQELIVFQPMILMDPTLNMRDLLPSLEAYLAKEDAEKIAKPKPIRVVARQKELSEYPNIASFVYQKMTSAGGLVDPSARLNDHDLHLLQKLVAREVSKRRKSKK
jgi:hypothetical protein